MPDDTDTNDRSPSTTWSWKTVRIPLPPEATRTARRRRSPFGHLPPWQPRKRLTLQVTYRGGAECFWEVTARGVTIRRPGVIAFHDLMREIERIE